MKKWFQELLGIDLLTTHLYDIRNNRLSDRQLLNYMEVRIAAVESGIGRIIAKLDPIYGISDLDPDRKAASDALGVEVIKRMQAEHLARQHQEGKV